MRGSDVRVTPRLMRLDVVSLDEREFARFYKVDPSTILPVLGVAAKRGSLTIGAGGVVHGNDGRVWGFLDILPGRAPKTTLRILLRFLRDRAADGIKEIRVTRDASLSTSGPLLMRLGFTKTDETYEDKEVWIWRA